MGGAQAGTGFAGANRRQIVSLLAVRVARARGVVVAKGVGYVESADEQFGHRGHFMPARAHGEG